LDPRRVPRIRITWAGVALTVIVVSYVLAFSAVTIRRYQTYAAFGDLATFEQILSNSAQGNWFGSTYGSSIFPYWSMVQDHIAEPVSPDSSYLEAHLEPGLLLLVPIYTIWPHAETLLVVQSAALGLAAVPVYFLARRLIPWPPIALTAAVAFLLSPAIAGINVVDFHGQAFALLWIGAAFYALYANRTTLYVVFFALGLMTNELASVTLALLGAYALVFKRRPVLGLGSMMIAAAYFFLAVTIIIPWFSPTSSYQFTSYFSRWGGSPLELLRTLVATPSDVLAFLTGNEQREYVLALFAPVGFLAFFAPEVLAIVGPVALANLLADSAIQRIMYSHYSASILSLIYMASVVGFARLLGFVGRRSRLKAQQWLRPVAWAGMFGYTAFAIAMNSQFSLWPALDRLRWETFVPPPNSEAMRRALAIIPGDASVSTTDVLATHLAGRRFLYLFPVHADDADYVVLPKDDTTSRIWPLSLEQLTFYTRALRSGNAFEVAFDEEGFLVLHRLTASTSHLESAVLQDDDPAVRYGGTWHRLGDSQSSGGSVHTSEAVGARAVADFDGARVLVVYRRCLSCGVADVSVDGVPMESADTYGPNSAQRYRLYKVAQGHHTITVSVSGRKNTLSSGQQLYFDAFIEDAQ
jgi:uncharacterized membrane protein